MAIGTAAAIGLGLAGVGGIISSSASKSAAKTAANAQTQASNQNAAIAREMYGQNQQALSPFMQSGAAAGGQINALLGLGGQGAQDGAFDNYRDSTGYQFRLGEGMNALNSGYAGAGVLQSGAAMKGAVEYGQNFASNEFGNYLGALGNQQGVGLSGASALAGVGQNYANSLAQFNNDAASAKGNAALIGGQNSFGNTLGMIGGGLFGYGR